jgi:hypothetical protein
MLKSLDNGIHIFFLYSVQPFRPGFYVLFQHCASYSDFAVSEDAGIEHKRRHPILKMDDRYSLTLHESFNCLQITYRRVLEYRRLLHVQYLLTSVEGAYVDGSYMMAA